MEGASLQLPKDLVEASIEKAVREAIASTTIDHTMLINSMVNEVLKEKVDDNGKPSRYSSAQPFLEWMCSKTIRETVQEVFQEELLKKKNVFRDALKREMAKKNSPIVKSFLNSLVGGVSKAAESKYRFGLTISSD